MAENAIGEAFIALRASFDEFRKEMGRVNKEVEKAVKPIQQQFQAIGASVGNAGKKMSKFVSGPIAAAGAGLFAVAQKTASAGDAIQKMALRTGFSTEALSELKHAAELSGTSLDGIENSVRRMQRSVFDLERGLATQTEAFAAMGLALEDLQGLSPEEQFNKITMALADVEDESRRAAIAQQVFGRQGTALLPMLAAGSDGIAAMRQEARDLGIVFDQEAADAAAQFNDDMDRLKKAFGGVFQELGTRLIPIMVNDFIPAIKENIIPLLKDFGEKLTQMVQWFADLDPRWQKIIVAAAGFFAVLGPVLLVLGPVISSFGTIIGLLPKMAALFGVLTGPIGLVVAAIAGAIAIGVLLYKNWDTVKDKIGAIWRGMANTVIGFINKIIGALNGMIRGINTLQWSVPDWVPVIGGKSFGFNLPAIGKIPALAAGGIVTQPTLALVGERGPEAVVPLDYLREERVVRHTGVIRVEGVNSAGQLVAVTEILADNLRADQDRYSGVPSARRRFR